MTAWALVLTYCSVLWCSVGTVGYAALGPNDILALFCLFLGALLWFGILTEVKPYGTTLQRGCCSSYRCNYYSVSITKVANNGSLHVFYHSNKGRLSGKSKTGFLIHSKEQYTYRHSLWCKHAVAIYVLLLSCRHWK